MFKKILFGLVGLSFVASLVVANDKFDVKGNFSGEPSCSEKAGCGCHGDKGFGDKFKNASIDDIKADVSKKISFQEKRLASEKSCLEKQSKEELTACLKEVKKEYKHDKKELKKERKELKKERKDKSAHEGN